MTNIQIINQQAVTTSLQVAQDFGKRHDHTLQDIKKLTTENLGVKNFFFEGTYTNERGREYPMYYMNRDGFTLLAMGFTGSKALQFKLDYINAFNKMEQAVKANLPTDPLELALTAALETRKEVAEIKQDVDFLKDNMRINTYQEKVLQDIVKRKVLKVLGGYKTLAYDALSSKTFRRAWNEFRNHFMISTYKELPAEKFNEGIEFLNLWDAPASLKLEIAAYSRQIEASEILGDE